MITYWDFQKGSYSGSGSTITDLDSTNNGALVGSVPYTSSTPNYLSLDASSSNYVRTANNLNPFLNPSNTGTTLSIFLWVYPTSDGVLLTEQGSTTPDASWHDAQIEWIDGAPVFGVWPHRSHVLDVEVYSTHGGTGSTTQYPQFPTTSLEFDRFFDTGYSNTTLAWSGTLDPSIPLNWTNYTTLTSAGVAVPNSGQYFSLKASGTFVPAETGTYSFRIDSDDASDLYIGGTQVVSYYGGHGIATFQYGTIDLVAGEEYTFEARTQEYSGGEGLIVQWQRPSQGTYSYQASEIAPEHRIRSRVSAGLNAWHYVGFTYDGSTMTAYVNGLEAGSASVARQTPYNNGGPTYYYYTLGYPTNQDMGSSASSTFRLGALHIWNDALSPSMVSRNFRATKSAYGV
jgi:hypothetical protein